MTRCDATSKKMFTRKVICDVAKNVFHTSDSPSGLHDGNDNDEPQEARLLAVIQLDCMNNKQHTNVDNNVALNGEAKIHALNCDESAALSEGRPPKELLSKGWKSAGVICEGERPKRIVSRRRGTQIGTKTEARSCERVTDSGSISNGMIDKPNCGDISDREDKYVPCGHTQGLCHPLAQSGYETSTTSHRRTPLLNGYVSEEGYGDSRVESHANAENGVSPPKPEGSSFLSNTYIQNCDPKIEASDTESQQGDVAYEVMHSPSNECEEMGGNTNKTGDALENNGTNLIVNYLPQNMSQEEIRSLFATIGEVDSCKLIRDKSTSQNLGYGFVNYIHSKDAERAIAKLNGLQLQNKTIKVSLARPSSESIKGANLYISGLPLSMSQKELEELFNPCGRIITSRILYDSNTGLSRGVGFIRFDQRAEAEKAIRKLNGIIPENAVEPITVKLANSPSAVTANSGNLTHNNFGFRNSVTGGLNYAMNDFGFTSPIGDSLLPEKPGHAAFTAMMLLQQAASQTLDPFSHLTRYPRLPLLPTAGSLLPQPHPFHHHSHRLSKQATFPRSGSASSRRLLVTASSASNSFQHQQNSTHLAQTAPYGPRNSVRLSHPAATTTTDSSSAVPNLFHSQPHLVPTLPTHSQQAIVYPRFKLPMHARPPAILGSTTSLPLNGFVQTAPLIFPTIPVPEQTGQYSSDVYASYGVNCVPTTHYAGYTGFAPSYSDPLPIPNAQPIALGYNTLNFANPLSHPISGVSGGIPGYAHPVPQAYGYSTGTPWCLFVCNLPPDTDDATLWRLFGPFGAVRSVKVIREPGTNRCRGFGFVTMTNYAEAVLAIHQLNGCLLGSRNIQVTFKLQFCPISK